MSESLRVTIVYEQGDDGWIIASIPEVPGTHSQGQDARGGTGERDRCPARDARAALRGARAGGDSRRQRAARARHRRVKRRDLERHLRAQGARLLREGGNHSYWGFDAERSTAVPRHREIDHQLARKDLRRPRYRAAERVGTISTTSRKPFLRLGLRLFQGRKEAGGGNRTRITSLEALFVFAQWSAFAGVRARVRASTRRL